MIRIHNSQNIDFTLVENEFIDRLMAPASGEYVKIYLYLLRNVSSGRTEFSISSFADFFDCTEADVSRALHYWERAGILRLSKDSRGQLCGLQLLPASSEGRTAGGSAAPEVNEDGRSNPRTVSESDESGAAEIRAMPEPDKSSEAMPRTIPDLDEGSRAEPRAIPAPDESGAAGIQAMSSLDEGSRPGRQSRQASGESRETDRPAPQAPAGRGKAAGVPSSDGLEKNRQRQLRRSEIQQLIFVAETYYGRPLSRAESDNLVYFINSLHMSQDLIEYLLEYCVQKGHKSARYTEKVAQAWSEKGITTVDQAREEVERFNSDYYTIFSALGVHGRVPVPAEKEYMDRWLREWDMPMEVVKEACKRTILQVQKPQLSYAEGILKKWRAAGVRSLADIQVLDAEHQNASASGAAQARLKNAASQPARPAGRFSNFQSSGSDWDAIGRKVALSKKHGV